MLRKHSENEVAEREGFVPRAASESERLEA